MSDSESGRESRPGNGFGRRALLTGAGASALALLLPLRPRREGLLSVADSISSAAAARPRFRPRLPIPRVLRGDDIEITMREARIPILPGRKTKMWTYGGSFPGPTIRRRAGQRTRVTFRHRLPRKAGDLTVHLHGGHTSSRDDGQPGGLTRSQKTSFYCKISPNLSAKQAGNDLLIKRGRKRTYVYELKEDGRPERAAFQWYHDHRLDRTGRNVWEGLAGMWILDDAVDDALPLPTGDRDIPLLVADRSFNRHNQLTNPFSSEGRPPNDGVTGHQVLVNGALRPHHRVSARRYRLRILNASNFRAYNVYLSDGSSLTQIGTDSGLMPKPVKRRRILLGPAERAEVIVDFRRSAGRSVELLSGRRSDGGRARGTKAYVGPLMQFRVGDRKPDNTSVPASLRPLPSWTQGLNRRSPVDRHWPITISGGLSPKWLIKGKAFNPARSDARPALGTTEVWAVTNKTGVGHVIHMHSTDWYMLSRNGRTPHPWEDCLKESFFLDPGDTIHVAARFTDHTGKFVIHCHMLDHEDHGLMGQFKVVRSTALQPKSDEVARRRRGEISVTTGSFAFGLPSSENVRGRELEFTPQAPRGDRLTRLDIAVDGEDARSLRGAALRRPVRLALATGSPSRVTLVGRTADGRLLGATRDFSR